MDNNEYNSLTDKLIQSGIIPKDDVQDNTDKIDEIYNIELDEDMSNSPFVSEDDKQDTKEQTKSKRLNRFDLELINNNDNPISKTTHFKIIKRFINIKEKMASKGTLNTFENFLFAFFPTLYKAKLAKDSMAKLSQLNIDAKKLLDKTIPYGESDIRYGELVKYLKFANKIQSEIKKESI